MSQSLNNVLDAMLSFIKENKWAGACFASSAINHMLLNEVGIGSRLCIGVFRCSGGSFDGGPSRVINYDHAWVEVNSRVYDVAITLGKSFNFGPALVPPGGIRGNPPREFRYGVDMSLDAETVHNVLPFGKFMMETLPFESTNLWGAAEVVAKKMGINVSREQLVEKYATTEWQIVKNG